MTPYLLAGLLILSNGWVAANHNAPEPDKALGEKTYKERCTVCHGVNGDGNNFVATVLDPPPKDFTSAESKKQLTLKRMIRSATEGRPGTAMMPWKDVLSPEEISAVIAYIRSQFMKLDS